MGKQSFDNYKITVLDDDVVAPEEVLVDSSSDHPSFIKPIDESIRGRFQVVFIALFMVVLGFVFKLAVVDGSYYADLALQNKTVSFSVPAPRGVILDAEGRMLAGNTPVFKLLIVSREARESLVLSDKVVGEISRILGESAKELRQDIESNINSRALFFVGDDLDKEQALALSLIDVRGIYVITATRRHYEDGHQFSSVIGYVGRVNDADLESDDYYELTDSVGRAGLEKEYEINLRGEHGRLFFDRQREERLVKEANSGSGLVLNINLDIQKNLYNSVFNVLREAGLSRAAAIVQNPGTGEVLALVSMPGYDNNSFTDEVTLAEYANLFENKNQPLFNRVIGGVYNPGSTIKPFIAMSGLEAGIITPDFRINDCISIAIANPFDPSEPYIFRNWRSDFGSFDLRRAIADSCNIYFFTVGGGFGDFKGLGIEAIARYLKDGWADKILGIDLPGEKAGFIPTPEWKEANRGEPWYLGDTYNVSIGQGDLGITPLWINSYISAIANGGKIFKPQVVKQIIGQNGEVISKFDPVALGALPFSPQTIGEVGRAMRQTVVYGTAKILNDLPVAVSAKTGTAEIIKGEKINALFTAFAPSENPEIAITILVEGSASNQGYAIRAANQFFRSYFDESRRTSVSGQ